MEDCPFCHNPLPPQAKYCPYCGQPVHHHSVPKGKLIAVVLIFVVLAVATLFLSGRPHTRIAFAEPGPHTGWETHTDDCLGLCIGGGGWR